MLQELKLAVRKAADARREQLEHDRLLRDPRIAVEHDLALRHGDGNCPDCD